MLSLAQKFGLAITTIEEILACRTIERATRVLDEEDTFELGKRFVQSGGHLVDFTGLLGNK